MHDPWIFLGQFPCGFLGNKTRDNECNRAMFQLAKRCRSLSGLAFGVRIEENASDMNRPKGLGLTAILMALCNAMGWTVFNYPNNHHPLKVLALMTIFISIGYVFIWFYWIGKNWARIAVLIVSGLNIYNLQSWSTVSRSSVLLATPFHIVLAARAVLGAALLYWLTTRPVVEFFKRDKVVVPSL